MKRSETATSATTTAAIATQSVDVEGAGVSEGAGGEGSTGSCTVAPFPGVAGATGVFARAERSRIALASSVPICCHMRSRDAALRAAISSSMNAVAVSNRSSGALAMARASTTSSVDATSARYACTLGTASVKCAATTRRVDFPTKGGRPASISNRTHPNE